MTAASDLWAAVVVDYDEDGLITLTNPGDPAAEAIDTTQGEAAALGVINIWPVYAGIAYDETNALHVEVAEFAVIALLWRRGGAATSIERIKWDEVFSPEGMIARVRRTDARAHSGPSSNSDVRQASGASDGRRYKGWSDRAALPSNFLPRRSVAD